MRLRRKAVLASVASVLWFGVFVSAGLAWDRAFPLPRFETAYRDGVPDVGREWYLSSDRDVLDYDVLYQGWWGTVPALKRADVLFLGNSRAVYAFRPEHFQQYLDPHGLRGYNLSFAGGADAFPREIIRRFDLRPKLIVVNSDGFFAETLTRFGVWASERSAWESWRMYHEYVASWTFRKHLHLWVPPWRDYITENRYQVWYRSNLTGGTRWPVGQNARNVITPTKPLPLNAQDQAVVDGLVAAQLPNLLAWRGEMAARGAMTVLALAPYSEHLTYFMTRDLAAKSGVPFIDAWPLGLEGQMGSHMNSRSSATYLADLMPQLLANPAVRAHLASTRRAAR
jgi:hypothetical protein